MSGMSVAPWWLIGAAVLFALAFGNALLGPGAEANGAVTLVIQVVELAAAVGIPMLASREEGTIWAGARTGTVMTVIAATVVLAWGATGLPPFPQIDLGPILGLSIAELLGIIVALAVIGLVGLVLGTIGGAIGRWLGRRSGSGDAAAL
jgi:hypothetical protein